METSKKENMPEPTAESESTLQDDQQHIDAELKQEGNELSAMQKQLAEISEKLNQEKDFHLRLRADFDNFRKRMVKEKEDFAKYSLGSAAVEFLPVLDNLERALSVDAQKTTVTKMMEGLQMIKKQFDDVLNQMGTQRIQTLGHIFNPDLHEALMHQPSDKPQNEIVLEIRAGYQIGSRVLRPAQVGVSSGPIQEITAEK